jgi:hypothetical protein
VQSEGLLEPLARIEMPLARVLPKWRSRALLPRPSGWLSRREHQSANKAEQTGLRNALYVPSQPQWT